MPRFAVLASNKHFINPQRPISNRSGKPKERQKAKKIGYHASDFAHGDFRQNLCFQYTTRCNYYKRLSKYFLGTSPCGVMENTL